MANRTSNERVSDKRLAELVSHYTNVDKQHNGWWVAVYWSLRELQERRSAVETSDDWKELHRAVAAWSAHARDFMSPDVAALNKILAAHNPFDSSPVEPTA